jgi:hypothetical protein
MPITPKPVVATETLNLRLAKETIELLDDYCRHLGGASDRTYVVTEALRLAVKSDRTYNRRKPKTGSAHPLSESAHTPSSTLSPHPSRPASPHPSPSSSSTSATR